MSTHLSENVWVYLLVYFVPFIISKVSFIMHYSHSNLICKKKKLTVFTDYCHLIVCTHAWHIQIYTSSDKLKLNITDRKHLNQRGAILICYCREQQAEYNLGMSHFLYGCWDNSFFSQFQTDRHFKKNLLSLFLSSAN